MNVFCRFVPNMHVCIRRLLITLLVELFRLLPGYEEFYFMIIFLVLLSGASQIGLSMRFPSNALYESLVLIGWNNFCRTLSQSRRYYGAQRMKLYS